MSPVLPISPPIEAIRRIGLLSTYPPKLCGLATFTNALKRELRAEGHHIEVVRIDDDPSFDPSPDVHPVAARLLNGDAASIRHAAAVLSNCDIAIIQHEYGIFGGPDGDEIIDVLEALEVPAIVVLHTVPLHPTPHQHALLGEISELAARVVVMTDAARTRLLEGYAVEEHRVITIAHGAAVPSPMSTMRSDATARPQLLTWGLLGPGKGIEHAIDAIALLGDLVPRPRYTVAGVTHPKVHLREGDTYRRSLIRRAESLGIADLVTFDDTYRDVANLTAFVASASVVILPYDSRDQVTSGVLVDAVAAGRPVIATAFPHAVELLTGGAGIVVAHGDPIALAAAIRTVLCDRGVRDDMAAHSRRLAPTLGWPAIGRAYAVLADELLSAVDAGAR